MSGWISLAAVILWTETRRRRLAMGATRPLRSRVRSAAGSGSPPPPGSATTHLGFNLKSEIETGHGTEDLEPVTESSEVGVAIGGGPEYRFSGVRIGAEVRYSVGVTSIVQDIGGQSLGVNNRAFSYLVSATVPWGTP